MASRNMQRAGSCLLLVATAAGCSTDPAVRVDAVAADSGTAQAADGPADAGGADAAPSAADTADGAPDNAVMVDGINGRPCFTDEWGPCPSGYECLTTGCAPVLPEGGRCNPAPGVYLRCSPGTSCIRASEREEASCVRNGSRGGECRPIRPRCDDGLGCYRDRAVVRHICLPGLPLGALCVGTEQLCSEGSDCLPVNSVPRCVKDGTAGGRCRASMSNRCDEGLDCSAPWGYEPDWGICGRRVPVGAECHQEGTLLCVDGASCVSSNGSRCVAVGGPGARCRADSPRCEAGLACGGLGGPATCQRPVPRSGSCAPIEGTTTFCTGGDTCSSADVAEPGECVPPGTVPGASCRSQEPFCDGGLRCSQFARYRNVCRIVAQPGDACDLGGARVECPKGTRCTPGTSTPTCMPSEVELGPNDSPAPAPAATTSTHHHGALPAGDQDCYAVTIAERTSLFLETCGGEMLLSLFSIRDGTSTELGRWLLRSFQHGPLGACGRVRPETHGAVRHLAAGAYSVCVRAPNAIASYGLVIGVLPPGR